ncbi:MAG: XdhC family protein [Cyanobacteria bacterium P01_G01_bin.38]
MSSTSSRVHQALYQKLCDQLQCGPVVLATVILAQGEVPCPVGTKMLIWGDAETFYGLSGAAAEQAVIQQAFEVLKTGIAQRVKLERNEKRGVMQVWLTRWQGSDAIATAQQLLKSVSAPPSYPPSRLVIPLVTGQAPYLLSPAQPSLRNLQGGDAFIEELVA